MLAISHSSVLPSAHWNSVGALISDPFHGSITLPACPPVNASRAALRLPAHDSGPGWLATPYLYDSCIRDFTPVYPGALHLPSKTCSLFGDFQALSRVRAVESSGFMERAMGIEPTSEAWEASILPLYDARSLFLIVLRN
jgi:hypothetical protein